MTKSGKLKQFRDKFSNFNKKVKLIQKVYKRHYRHLQKFEIKVADMWNSTKTDLVKAISSKKKDKKGQEKIDQLSKIKPRTQKCVIKLYLHYCKIIHRHAKMKHKEQLESREFKYPKIREEEGNPSRSL